MIENWRLFGGVRVRLSCFVDEDSLAVLVVQSDSLLTTLPVQLVIMTECF
jgi:hypothetical protein